MRVRVTRDGRWCASRVLGRMLGQGFDGLGEGEKKAEKVVRKLVRCRYAKRSGATLS